MRQPYETLSARARSSETALPRTLLEACGRQRNAKRIFETATSRPVKTFPGQVLHGNPSRTLRHQTEQREMSLNLGLQLSVVRKKLNVVADGGRRKLSVVADGTPEKGWRYLTFIYIERALVAIFNLSDYIN